MKRKFYSLINLGFILAIFISSVALNAQNQATKLDANRTVAPECGCEIISSEDVSCHGGSDGTATVAGTGTGAPFSYIWSDGQTNATAVGLSAGTYFVEVYNSTGQICSSICEVTIDEPLLLECSIEGADLLCNGDANGAADLTVTGGTEPYSFLWSNGETTEDLSGLNGGTYSVAVTDANGCETSCEVTINEPLLLECSIEGADLLCNGDANGVANLTVTGGTEPYSFLWSNGETTEDLSGLNGGTYSVAVTDANGCETSCEVTINEPLLLECSIEGADLLCNGDANGVANLTVTGGTEPYSFLWSNGETTEDLSGLNGGTYSVAVTDANGCETSCEVTINEPLLLECSIEGADLLCNGDANGAADLTVTGGTEPYSFLWSNGETTEDLSGLNGGTYSVAVTDANGCETSCEVTIDESLLLACDIIAVQNASCSDCTDGSATAVASGGTSPYSYEWSDGQMTATATNLLPGDYSVTITDANECTSTCDITIDFDEQEGCTYTQGYWKTHSNKGPAPYDPAWGNLGDIDGDGDAEEEDEDFYYSGQTYYEVFWTPVSGNAYYILARQFIAAHLNFLNSADPSAAQAEFNIAEALFNNPANTPDKIKKLKKEAKKVWTDPAGILDDYNKGDIGPGHCDDEGDRSADELTGIINTKEYVSISAYPNPFMNAVTIEFTMEEDTDVTLEVYNMTGAKVASLYKGDVQANQTYSFDFDGIAHVNQGTFIYVLRAGKTVKMGRLVMMK